VHLVDKVEAYSVDKQKLYLKQVRKQLGTNLRRAYLVEHQVSLSQQEVYLADCCQSILENRLDLEVLL